MSEYIPTTKEIEELATSYLLDESITSAAFDRWLNQVRADAFDEGWGNGFIYGYMKKPEEENYKNPYKQGEEQ